MKFLQRVVPLTAAGWVVVVTALLCFVAAWQLGWVELFVATSACLILLVTALPFVLGGSAVDLERNLQPDRVTVGKPAVIEMTAVNNRSRRSKAQLVTERVGRGLVTLDLPALDPGETQPFSYPAPTEKRGAIVIGPARISKTDPLSLMTRSIGETGVTTLWVHPRTMSAGALSAGFAKDLDGPTFDTSPAGDVAFHTIREYEPGDDYRHVHWMSTARTGTLMVRQYVDNRRPHITVVADASPEHVSEEQFETAVEIAASLGVSALLDHRTASVFVGSNVMLGSAAPGSVEDVLDRLCVVQPELDFDMEQAVNAALDSEPGTSVTVCVVGDRPVEELLALVETIRRSSKVIFVRLVEAEAVVIPRARVLAGQSLEAFSVAWEAMAS